MTKTKIGVEIHKNGSENDFLLRLVASINNGEGHATINDLIGYINIRQAAWASISKLHFIQKNNYIHISEDGGQTFTLSLTWKEVSELDLADNTDDIKDVLQGPGELERDIEQELKDYRNTHRY